MTGNISGKSDQELALWMLDKMRDSEEFLGVIQAARVAGKPDVLDTLDYVARHKQRLKRLFQSDDEEPVEVPASLAGAIEEIAARDMLSGREEVIEKALAAYLERHPEVAKDLPKDWQSTFEAARSEIEGKTHGAFEPGFTASLAAAARQEMERQASAERAAGNEHSGRES